MASSSSSAINGLIEEYVSDGTPWENLPEKVKNTLGNSQQVYQEAVKTYSLDRQLPYDTSPARFTMSKQDYYNELINYLRNELRIFPYQFSDIIVNKLGILPFNYYTEMMTNIMKNEKSYDILPNFTAADINMLMGIGRNQYIDIMNKARSQKWTWRFNKGIVKNLLPPHPIKIKIQYWWIVEAVPMPQQEFMKIYQTMNEDEILAIGIVKSEGQVLACRVPYKSLVSIFRRGLVHIQVPINNDDLIVLPPLKNFIMNRTPNDHFEKLLYDILVSIDERTTVGELACILEVDVDLVKTAVSVCCRLGFAKKKIPKPQNLNETSEDQYHNSWQKRIDEYHEQIRSQSILNPSQISSAFASLENTSPSEGKSKRIGFMFDSSLAAYLMMGNLAEGLKNHAVTLFEVGKMPDELMDDFLHELDQVKSTGEGEGEARRYYRHAIALRSTLRFLRHNVNFKFTNSDGGVDMVRSESLNNLDPATKLRILETNYVVMIAMAPLAAGTLTLPSCIPRFYGSPIPHVSSPWFKLYLYHACESGPPSLLFVKGQRIRKLHPILQRSDRVMLAGWEQEPNFVNGRVLLQVLNESLMNSPNLVQVFEEDEGKPSITFDVCFPYERPNYDNSALLEKSDTIQTEPFDNGDTKTTVNKTYSLTDEEDSVEVASQLALLSNTQGLTQLPRNDDFDSDMASSPETDIPDVHVTTKEEDDQIEVIMNRLSQKLHLDTSFGCVRMMRTSGRDGRIKIYPVELFFGIPLADKHLSERVCDAIVKKDLFNSENLEKHTTDMRLMCKEFLEFIDSHLDSELRLEDDSIYPTRNIFFDGQKVTSL